MKDSLVRNSVLCARRASAVSPCSPWSRSLVVLAAVSLLALAATGCQVLTYTSPTGERFTRSSLGATTSIHSLALEATTNGLRRVELRGYENDSSKTLGVVTGAAVKAALEAIR